MLRHFTSTLSVVTYLPLNFLLILYLDLKWLWRLVLHCHLRPPIRHHTLLNHKAHDASACLPNFSKIGQSVAELFPTWAPSTIFNWPKLVVNHTTATVDPQCISPPMFNKIGQCATVLLMVEQIFMAHFSGGLQWARFSELSGQI